MCKNKLSNVISLNDFKPNELFILLDRNYKQSLLNNSIRKAGSQHKLALLIKKKIKYPKIKQSTVSFLLKKKTLRFDLVLFLCRYSNIKFDEKTKIL